MPNSLCMHFKFRPGVLFNVGLLTLINMDSLMFLAKPCPYLPIPLDVILCYRITCVTAMMMHRGEILKVLFESFSKAPRGFPYVFIIAGKVTTFAVHWLFVPGETRKFLMVLLPLKWV